MEDSNQHRITAMSTMSEAEAALDIDTVERTWDGPPISREAMEMLIEWPTTKDYPATEPYDLGLVYYKVVLFRSGHQPTMVDGHLSEFFQPLEYGTQPSATSLHDLSRFIPSLFIEAVRQKFDLDDAKFELWLHVDWLNLAIHDSHGLLDALELFNKAFVVAEPWTHHVLSFLVVRHDDPSRQHFSVLPQPSHPFYAANHDAGTSSQPDDNAYSPATSLYAFFEEDGNDIHTPGTTADDVSQTDSISLTPATSSHDDSEGVEYSDSEYGDDEESDESEGLQQMNDADYVEPAEGFDLHPPPSPEPVETPGILESIDTDSKKGSDVVDGDLDSILPVSDGPTDDQFEVICSLLLLNPDEHKDADRRSVAIPHTDINITPRQYASALGMVSCGANRNIHGGILADVPGTGKTHTCIAAVLLRALIAYNMAEVKKEWQTREYEAAKGSKTREFKHLPRDAVGDENETCPCGNQQGILCYANAQGATRGIGDSMSRGVSLILAPQGVIEDWMTLLIGAKLNRKYFEPCLIHTTAHRELACPPFFSKRFQLKATARHDGFPKGYKPQVADFDYAYTLDADQAKQPERFVIVTTHQIALLRETFQVPVLVTVDRKKERTSVYGLPVGAMLVDEFHKVRARASPVVELAHEHRRIMGDNTDFWSVSGTIMPKSTFLDLDTTMAILQRREWSSPDHAHHGKQQERVQELERAYLDAVSADHGSAAAVGAFKQRAARFFDGLITRYTMESRFFGQRITRVKEVKPVKKTFTTPTEFVADLQALADQVRAEIRAITQTDSCEQVVRSLQAYIELTPLQMASTFPAAARLMLDGELKVDISTLRALIRKARGDVAAVAELASVADAVTAHSAKLDDIVSIVRLMDEDEQTRPKPGSAADNALAGSRDDMRLKKLVVVTPTLAEAVFLYLGLRRRLSSSKPAAAACPVALLHADLLASEKHRLTTDFRSLRPGSCRVLVTPYEVGGTGLNLQTASYQVLTGPLRTKDYEVQAFARTNREGAGCLELHHFLYLTDDNPADRLVVARQGNRRVGSDPFDVLREFRVVENDGGEE